jgi:hypothetical protein
LLLRRLPLVDWLAAQRFPCRINALLSRCAAHVLHLCCIPVAFPVALFPCCLQGFSKANQGGAEEKARRNVLVAVYLSVLAELKWDYFILENVAGLLSGALCAAGRVRCGAAAGCWQPGWPVLG